MILDFGDFEKNIETCFERVDAGEHVFIRRNNKLYLLASVDEEDLAEPERPSA